MRLALGPHLPSWPTVCRHSFLHWLVHSKWPCGPLLNMTIIVKNSEPIRNIVELYFHLFCKCLFTHYCVALECFGVVWVHRSLFSLCNSFWSICRVFWSIFWKQYKIVRFDVYKIIVMTGQEKVIALYTSKNLGV